MVAAGHWRNGNHPQPRDHNAGRTPFRAVAQSSSYDAASHSIHISDVARRRFQAPVRIQDDVRRRSLDDGDGGKVARLRIPTLDYVRSDGNYSLVFDNRGQGWRA